MLTLTHVQLTDGGRYDVVVTNLSGSVTSEVARLDVDASFTVITEGPAVTDLGSSGWGGWADYDDDGYPDLAVARYPLGTPAIYHNNRDGTFARLPDPPSLQSALGFWTWADWDNDGRLDLCVASLNGTSAVYRNLGNGEFERPVGTPTLGGKHEFAAWADYDNDGFLDLFVSGYMSGNKLFHNNGDGSFTKVTTGRLVNDRPLNGGGNYGGLWFDYDNDGFLDVYVLNGDDNGSISTANQLYHNNGNSNAWLTVRVIGTASNRGGVGAKVRVLATYAGRSRWQRRDITAGTISNGNHLYAHFGLGDATVVDTVRIEWPSGIVQELTNVPAKQFLTVSEPARLQVVGAGAFRIQSWNGQAFEVQMSTDLKQWSPVTTVTNLTGTLEYPETAASPLTSCFYRVKSL